MESQKDKRERLKRVKEIVIDKKIGRKIERKKEMKRKQVRKKM